MKKQILSIEEILKQYKIVKREAIKWTILTNTLNKCYNVNLLEQQLKEKKGSMKYNIFTIFNSNYIKFAKIFLNSLYENCDLSKIDTIYIYNWNLKEEHKEWLKKFNKVKLIENFKEKYIKNENEWTNTIVQKTYILKQLLELENCYPLVMIDIDCMFLKDISDLIDEDFDIQFCKRNFKPKPLIASFVSVNNKNSLSFIDLWIKKIPGINGKIKETPALCNIYKKEKDNYKIGLIDYNIVSASENKYIEDNTRIIHFKGSCIERDGVNIRLNKVNNLKKIKNIKSLINKYLKE